MISSMGFSIFLRWQTAGGCQVSSYFPKVTYGKKPLYYSYVSWQKSSGEDSGKVQKQNLSELFRTCLVFLLAIVDHNYM